MGGWAGEWGSRVFKNVFAFLESTSSNQSIMYSTVSGITNLTEVFIHNFGILN